MTSALAAAWYVFKWARWAQRAGCRNIDIEMAVNEFAVLRIKGHMA